MSELLQNKIDLIIEGSSSPKQEGIATAENDIKGGKTYLTIGKKIRKPIVNAINTLNNTLKTELASRAADVEDDLQEIASYTNALIDAKERAKEAVEEEKKIKTAEDSLDMASKTLTSLRTGTIPVEYPKDDKGNIVRTVAMQKLQYRGDNESGYWQFDTPRWPQFPTFKVDRVTQDTDTVEYDGINETKVTIADRLSSMKFTTSIYGTNLYGYESELSHDKNKHGQYADRTYARELFGDYDYRSNEMRIPIVKGRQGDDSLSRANRPILKQVWKNASVSSGMDFGIIPMSALSYPYTLDDFDGLIVTFQKIAFKQNPGSAKSSSNMNSTGKVFVPGTDTVIISNNWDWRKQVSVYVPKYGSAVASMVDDNGVRLSRTVWFGATTNLDGASFPLADEYKWTGGYYSNVLKSWPHTVFVNGKATDGTEDESFYVKSITSKTLRTYSNLIVMSSGTLGGRGIFNVDAHYNYDLYADRTTYAVQIHYLYPRDYYATHGYRVEGGVGARLFGTNKYLKSDGKENDFDKYVAKWSMVPVSIIGVANRLPASKE